MPACTRARGRTKRAPTTRGPAIQSRRVARHVKLVANKKFKVALLLFFGAPLQRQTLAYFPCCSLSQSSGRGTCWLDTDASNRQHSCRLWQTSECCGTRQFRHRSFLLQLERLEQHFVACPSSTRVAAGFTLPPASFMFLVASAGGHHAWRVSRPGQRLKFFMFFHMSRSPAASCHGTSPMTTSTTCCAASSRLRLPKMRWPRLGLRRSESALLSGGGLSHRLPPPPCVLQYPAVNPATRASPPHGCSRANVVPLLQPTCVRPIVLLSSPSARGHQAQALRSCKVRKPFSPVIVHPRVPPHHVRTKKILRLSSRICCTGSPLEGQRSFG